MIRKLILIALVTTSVLFAFDAFAAENNHGDFVYAKGADLMLHGKPFRYVGANCYYLMVYSVQPDMRKYGEEVFDDAEKMGLTVIRTWAFNDGEKQWNVLQRNPGSYKESTFAALDHVIAQAKKRGMYLILTLGNNWNDYGGIKQYLDWSPTALKKEHDEFFTDENTRQYFKDHIKAVLTRENTITGIKYKDDPTILAWALMNEPEAENDLSCDLVHNWLAEMSAYAKSIDPNHLIMTGEEGFYKKGDEHDWKFSGAKGGDFIRNTSIPTIDVASFHLWPCSDKYCLTPEETVNWIKMHADDAKRLGKPLILGEYGEYRGYNGDTVVRDKFYKLVLEVAEKEGVAGTNFWFLPHNSYRRYDDDLGVYYPDDKSTIEIIKSAAERLKK